MAPQYRQNLSEPATALRHELAEIRAHIVILRAREAVLSAAMAESPEDPPRLRAGWPIHRIGDPPAARAPI